MREKTSRQQGRPSRKISPCRTSNSFSILDLFSNVALALLLAIGGLPGWLGTESRLRASASLTGTLAALFWRRHGFARRKLSRGRDRRWHRRPDRRRHHHGK